MPAGLSSRALLLAIALPLIIAIGAAASSASSATALAACQANRTREATELARVTEQLGRLHPSGDVEKQLKMREAELRAAREQIEKLKTQCGWWCAS